MDLDALSNPNCEGNVVRIVADSTCDLSEDIINSYGITIVPLHIVLGDTEHRDGVDITPKEIYDWCEKEKTTPKTSAVSFDDVQTALEPVAQSGDEAVVFVISEAMSTTGNVFRMVIEDLEAEDRIFVFDSQNLSVGTGLLVLEACEMAQKGMSASQIIAEMNTLSPKVRSSFVIDTLTYLARGGRCSSITALAGGMLKIHPMIVVRDGEMEADKKYRGQMKNVIMDYVHDLEADLLRARKNRVIFVGTCYDEEILNEIREYLESLNHFDSVIRIFAGGVIASHCGPGTQGVFFIEG